MPWPTADRFVARSGGRPEALALHQVAPTLPPTAGKGSAAGVSGTLVLVIGSPLSVTSNSRGMDAINGAEDGDQRSAGHAAASADLGC